MEENVTKTALLEKINELTAKANTRKAEIDKINKQPDYKGRFEPLAWQTEKSAGKAPNYSRSVGERPYSLLKVAQLARGLISESDATEEIQISNKLYNAFTGANFSEAYHAKKSWLIPLHTDYIPKDNTANENLVGELKQKMVLPPVDQDQLNFLERKGAWKVDKTGSTWGTLADSIGASFVEPPRIVELLAMQYKLEAFSRAGATQIPMWPNGRAIISKIQQGSSAFYADEGINFANQLSNQVSGQLNLVAHKIAVLISLSNESLRFAMPATESMLRYDMARMAALFSDAEMFNGSGGTHLKGLLTYPYQNPPWQQGVDSLLNYNNSPNPPAGLGTNGNILQPQDVDQMVNQLPDEVSDDTITFLMTRILFGAVSSRRASVLTAGDNQGVFVGQRLVGISEKISDALEGYRTVWSSNVPTNRVKGNASNLTVAIAGRFSDWVIARMGVGEIVSNSFDSTSWYSDTTSLRLIQQIDAGPRYLASFDIYDQLVNG